MGVLNRRYLTLSDFQEVSNLTNPVQRSPVLTYTVPLKIVTIVDPYMPVFANVYAKFTKTLVAGDISSKTVTVTVPYKVAPQVASRNLPIICKLDTGSGVETQTGTVYDASGARVTIRATFTATPTADMNYTVYYPVDNVRFDISVITPEGNASTTHKLIESMCGILNTVDPNDAKQMEKLAVKYIVPAMEDHKIQFRVESSLPIVFNEVQYSNFELPVIEIDEVTLAAMYNQAGGNAAVLKDLLNSYIRTGR